MCVDVYQVGPTNITGRLCWRWEKQTNRTHIASVVGWRLLLDMRIVDVAEELHIFRGVGSFVLFIYAFFSANFSHMKIQRNVKEKTPENVYMCLSFAHSIQTHRKLVQ